jgi:hypothetical protein
MNPLDHALEKVRAELALYGHPFFEFSASPLGNLVEVAIRATIQNVHTPDFRFTVSLREIEHSQFRWSFQSLLYGSMNDYMVELFIRVPGDG